MNQTNFKVLHYDDTISLHGDIDQAIEEAKKRLEPWRDKGDRTVRQVDETPGTGINRVIVVTSVGEPTDAESLISPCGEWIDARECLPRLSQAVLACFLEENETNGIVKFDVSYAGHIRWKMQYDGKRAWWRPLPALPAECEGAAQC